MKKIPDLLYFDVESVCDFNIPGIDNFIDGRKEANLKKSKMVSLWSGFFQDWFSICLNLREIEIISSEERMPGYSMVIVPKEITVKKCLPVIGEKLGMYVDPKLDNLQENRISFLRKRNKTTYLRYGHSYGNLMILDVILLSVFRIYIGKKNNGRCEWEIKNMLDLLLRKYDEQEKSK